MSSKSKYRSLVKDTLIFSLGKFGSKFILFLLVPLYTHFLSTDEYGISELVFTISQIIVPIVSVMIFDGMMRFGLEKGANKSNVLLVGFSLVFLDLIITLALVPVTKIYEPITEWRWFMYWNIVLYIAYNVELNYLKVNDQNKAFALVSVLQTLFLASLNVLFLVFLNMGIKGYLLATNVSYLLSFVITFFIGNVWAGLRSAVFDKQLFRLMLIYSAPLALNTLAWHIVSSTDKIMLERMIDANALGLYTLAAKIPSLINVFIAIFQQSWGISSIKEYESSNEASFYSNILKVYYIGIFTVCLFLSSVMKPFMSVYVGRAFSESWKYVPLLLVSACFSALSVYYAGIYGALKKSVNIMNTVLISSVINIAINFLLIKTIGVFGAVIGTLVSYIAMTVIRIIDVNRIIKIQINWLVFIINSILLITHAVLCSLDFHILIISFVIISAFAIINYREIKNIGSKIVNNLFRK